MRKTANISLAEALLALLAEDLNDHDTTSIHAVTHSTLWEDIHRLQKSYLLVGTSTCITDASLHVNQEVKQTSKAESKSDSNSQLGPSKREARKALPDSDATLDESDCDKNKLTPSLG